MINSIDYWQLLKTAVAGLSHPRCLHSIENYLLNGCHLQNVHFQRTNWPFIHIDWLEVMVMLISYSIRAVTPDYPCRHIKPHAPKGRFIFLQLRLVENEGIWINIFYFSCTRPMPNVFREI